MTKATAEQAQAFAARVNSAKHSIFATGGESLRGIAALAVEMGLVRRVMAHNVAAAPKGWMYEAAQ